MAVKLLEGTELAKRLLEAKTVADVDTILAAIDNLEWKALGGKPNNHALVNAISDPGDALVERVTNAQDAVIERDVILTGKTDLSSPRQAVAAFYPIIKDGKLENLANTTERRAIANQVRVTLRESGADKRPTVTVFDVGTGQHPSDFEMTLVSLNEQNKRTKLYQQGAYGWGGASSFAFAAYTILISHRQPKLRRDGQADLAGWTIVRENPLDDDPTAKQGLYEYLTIGGEIPTIAPDDLPESYRDWFGTSCTLVEYELSRFSEAAWSPRRGVWLMFNAILFDSVLPFVVYDERAKAAGNKVAQDGMVIAGNTARLTKDERNQVSYTHSYAANFDDGGHAAIRYWVVESKSDSKSDWERSRTWVPGEQAVAITHNGQRQGTFPRELFERLGLSALAKYLIVQVDCDTLTWKSKRQLFATTRDRLKENPLTEELRKKVAEALSSDPKLAALDRQRKEAALKMSSKEQTDKINKLLSKAIESYKAGKEPAFRKLFSSDPELPVYGDQPLVKTESPDDDDDPPTAPEEPVVYVGEPTQLVVVNGLVKIHAGQKGVVRLRLDAPDGYIGNGIGNGASSRFQPVVTKGNDQFWVAGHSELLAGTFRCTISAEKAQPGDRGRVMFTVVRSGDKLPLTDSVDIEAIERPKLRVKQAGDIDGKAKGPNVKLVPKEGWDDLGFNDKIVARVEPNDPKPGMLTIYVNGDYPPIDEKLLKEKKVNEEDVQAYKAYWAASMALLAWIQDSEISKSEQPPSKEQREAELRRGSEMFLWAEGTKW